MLEDLRFQKEVGEAGSGKEWGGEGFFSSNYRSMEIDYGRLGNKNT